MWCEIKNRQLLDYQFHRQVPMLDYIVDFYCHELALVIEIDGESHYHDDAPDRDALRQKRIEQYKITFLRFDDKDVKQNMSFVLNSIYQWISDYKEKTDTK
nr:endonuclease domain-containing protein [Fulvivirga marina]